jgi:hypothetical protein
VQALIELMKPIRTSNDLAEMLAADKTALFVWVNWSTYARHGSEIYRGAAKLAAERLQESISWFVADLSSPAAAPVNPALNRWLESQDKKGNVSMFPNIHMGDGSVVWIKNGEVVGFEASAVRSGTKGLLSRIEEVLA